MKGGSTVLPTWKNVLCREDYVSYVKVYYVKVLQIKTNCNQTLKLHHTNTYIQDLSRTKIVKVRTQTYKTGKRLKFDRTTNYAGMYFFKFAFNCVSR